MVVPQAQLGSSLPFVGENRSPLGTQKLPGTSESSQLANFPDGFPRSRQMLMPLSFPNLRVADDLPGAARHFDR
jgi:hypothetical protein